DPSRAHPARGGETHGAAQQAGPPANDQAKDSRRAKPSAPGPATARIQAVLTPERETMAEKTKKPAHLGTGRRKSAVARVRMTEGSGKITINGRTVDEYFTEIKDRNAVHGPLEATEMLNRVDVTVLVQGGGITGQSGAICQGVARALKQMFGLSTEAESTD